MATNLKEIFSLIQSTCVAKVIGTIGVFMAIVGLFVFSKTTLGFAMTLGGLVLAYMSYHLYTKRK